MTKSGHLISAPGFHTDDWHRGTVPCTVLGALADLAVFEDPGFGLNLSRIPRAPFQRPWWFRMDFSLSEVDCRGFASPRLDGVNYRANVWVNRLRIADSAEVRGAFRRFALEISKRIRPGLNGLAFEVVPPEPGDFSTGFVDWNPPPLDRNMGMFRSVALRFARPVSIEDPFVMSDLAQSTAEAALTVRGAVAKVQRNADELKKRS